MAGRGVFIAPDDVPQAAPAPRFSRSAAGQPASPPAAGSDTEAVLGELGYDAETIARLRGDGVLT